MNNELQKDEFYLKGDLGCVKIGRRIHPITKVFKANDGTTTLTVTPFPIALEITFEKDHEVINPKPLTESKK